MNDSRVIVSSSSRPVAELLRALISRRLEDLGVHASVLPSFVSTSDLAAFLEGHGALDDSVVIVDIEEEYRRYLQGNRRFAHPWSLGRSRPGFFERQGLAIELLLGFPEVHFVFLVGLQGPDAPTELTPQQRSLHVVNSLDFETVVAAICRHANGYRPLFDATGLRSGILLARYAGSSRPHPSNPISQSRRTYAGIVADDESDFASLNAFVAFLCGFRVWLSSSHAEARLLVDGESPALVIADWDLQYPDLPREATTDEKGRLSIGSVARSLLDLAPTEDGARLVVSTSPPSGEAFGTLSKPYGGVFSLIGISAVLKCRRDDASRHVRDDGNEHNPRGHSAPHSTLVIAERLLVRARRLRRDGPLSSREWVRIAMLALQAKEMLNDSPSARRHEALLLQHEAETHAESCFLGNTADVDPEPRLDAIEKEFLPGAPNELDAAIARFDFQSQAVNALLQVYRRYDKLNAVDACLRRLGTYDLRSMSVSRKVSWLQVLGWRYVNRVTKSGTELSALIKASALVVFLFTIVFILLAASDRNFVYRPQAAGAVWSLANKIPQALIQSGLTFLTFQIGGPLYAPQSPVSIWPTDQSVVHELTPGEAEWATLYSSIWHSVFWVVSVLEVAIAYLHLGLFISILHRRLVRGT